MNNRLKWYLTNKDKLAPGDRFNLKGDITSIVKMKSKTKKQWIRRLDRLKDIYDKEKKICAEGQKKITAFFCKRTEEEETRH